MHKRYDRVMRDDTRRPIVDMTLRSEVFHDIVRAQAFPDRVRLRPDPQLQRLGPGAERDARRDAASREGRGPGAQQPGPAGRRARLSDSARPGVPQRPARASGRDAAARCGCAHNIPVLVDFLGAGVDGYQFSFFVISAAPREVDPLGARGHRGARPHLSAPSSSTTRRRRGAVDRAGAGRLRQGGGRRGAREPARRARPIAPSTSATAARTCT